MSESYALVESAVQRFDGRLTPQEIATATGLSLDDARDALARMLERYEVDVAIDERGIVLFDFAMPLRRWRGQPLRIRLRAIASSIVLGARKAFRWWIAAMLILYSGAFASYALQIVVLTIVHALQSRSERRRVHLLAFIRGRLRGGFQMSVERPEPSRPSDEFRHRLDRFRRRSRKNPDDEMTSRRALSRSIFEAACEFALGEYRPRQTRLAYEREIAAHVRAYGALSVTDIVVMTGVGLDRAQRMFVDALHRFEGHAEISEDGMVIGTFAGFIAGASNRIVDPIVPVWDENVRPYVHSRLSNANGSYVFFMAFLALAIVALASFLSSFTYAWTSDLQIVYRWLLIYVPFGFIVTYFVIAGVRRWLVAVHEFDRTQRALRAQILRIICYGRRERLSVVGIQEQLLLNRREMSHRFIEQTLRNYVDTLDGTFGFNARGERIARFERIWRELGVTSNSRPHRVINDI